MKNFSAIFLTMLFAMSCSRSPGPGDTLLEMNKKMCDQQSLMPMVEYAAPESVGVIGLVASLAEDEKKGPKIKEELAKKCAAGFQIAEEKIDGDIATVIFKGDPKPQTMKKIEGKWKLVIKKNDRKEKAERAAPAPEPQTPEGVAEASEQQSDVPERLTDIRQLDGEWYSPKWKYGYTLTNGKGIATVSNSEKFQVGQEIVRLYPVGENKFTGENIYKDGKFYRVNVTLMPNGKLYFEGEKNVKWDMEKVTR